MQHIKLVLTHLVDNGLDLDYGQEMAGRVEHESAPLETRKVFNVRAGNAHGCTVLRVLLRTLSAARKQLCRGHRTIEKARARARLYPHAGDTHLKRIAFRI